MIEMEIDSDFTYSKKESKIDSRNSMISNIDQNTLLKAKPIMSEAGFVYGNHSQKLKRNMPTYGRKCD